MTKRGLIIINFKDYKEAIGKNAIKLAEKLDAKNVWLIVNAIDLRDVIKSVKKSKVLVEHADPVETGAFTGAVSFSEVKAANAHGVLLNHSEKQMKFNQMKKGVTLAKKYKLKIIISSINLKEAIKISRLKPDYVAIELPELISGKISISQAKPELIKKAAKKIKNLIVGAGVHSKEDVNKALEYGAKGILISSAIVKSKDPRKMVQELMEI